MADELTYPAGQSEASVGDDDPLAEFLEERRAAELLLIVEDRAWAMEAGRQEATSAVESDEGP